jgi:hypothetical protein
VQTDTVGTLTYQIANTQTQDSGARILPNDLPPWVRVLAKANGVFVVTPGTYQEKDVEPTASQNTQQNQQQQTPPPPKLADQLAALSSNGEVETVDVACAGLEPLTSPTAATGVTVNQHSSQHASQHASRHASQHASHHASQHVSQHQYLTYLNHLGHPSQHPYTQHLALEMAQQPPSFHARQARAAIDCLCKFFDQQEGFEQNGYTAVVPTTTVNNNTNNYHVAHSTPPYRAQQQHQKHHQQQHHHQQRFSPVLATTTYASYSGHNNNKNHHNGSARQR